MLSNQFTNITNINTLVTMTLHQEGVKDIVKSLQTQIRTDLNKQALYNFCYSVALSRLKMLIRTQPDENSFKLYDDLRTDIHTTSKLFLQASSHNDCIRYIKNRLYKHYDDKLKLNKSHRIEKLVNVKAINKMMIEYLHSHDSKAISSQVYTFVNDLAHDVVVYCYQHNVDILKMLQDCNRDVKALRMELMKVKTDVVTKRYQISSKGSTKTFAHTDENESIDYLYSIKADLTKHKLINITSADTITIDGNYYIVDKQHYFYTDLLGYIKTCISRNSHSKNISDTLEASDDDDNKSIFDCLIYNVDTGYTDLAYLRADDEMCIKAFYRYLLNMGVFPKTAKNVCAIITLKMQGYKQNEIAKLLQLSTVQITNIWRKYADTLKEYLQLTA